MTTVGEATQNSNFLTTLKPDTTTSTTGSPKSIINLIQKNTLITPITQFENAKLIINATASLNKDTDLTQSK